VARAQQAITLNGAVQFNDDHVFTRALVRFEELVKQYYGAAGELRAAQELLARAREAVFRVHVGRPRGGLRIVSRPHVHLQPRRALIDAPFLFRDLAHWNQVLDQDLFKPPWRTRSSGARASR
jgi:TRAP-type transport system periplasmic protein